MVYGSAGHSTNASSSTSNSNSTANQKAHKQQRHPANSTPDQQQQQQQMRLVVLGTGGVGKSAITIQFVQQYFVLDYDPTIADAYTKQLFVDEKLYKLEVMDTAGQEEFFTMNECYLRTGDGFLLVFSLTSRESLDYVLKLKRHIDRLRDRDGFPIILLGNKSDLEEERQVSRQEAERTANAMQIPYLECSAKYRLNIDQAFHDLVRLVRQFQISERQDGHAPDATDQHPNGWGDKKKRKNCRIQ